MLLKTKKLFFPYYNTKKFENVNNMYNLTKLAIAINFVKQSYQIFFRKYLLFVIFLLWLSSNKTDKPVETPPKLSGDEQLLPLHRPLINFTSHRPPHRFLVAVEYRAVDQPVPPMYGVPDRGEHFVVGALWRAETDGGHQWPVVEFYWFFIGHGLFVVLNLKSEI